MRENLKIITGNIAVTCRLSIKISYAISAFNLISDEKEFLGELSDSSIFTDDGSLRKITSNDELSRHKLQLDKHRVEHGSILYLFN